MAGLYTAIKIILKYKKKPTMLIHCINIVGLFGGGHGTRTHEAVTPYSLSRRAP